MKMELPASVLKAAQRSTELAQALQNGKTQSQDTGITADNATPTNQAPDTLPPKKPEDTPQPQPVDYEAKYLTLKGKYDTEVPRLHQTVKALQDSQARMASEIETLKRTETTKESVPTKLDVDFEKLGEYGEDFGKLGTVIEDLTRKLTDTQKELAETKAKIGSVSENQQVTEQQARTQYMSSVRAGVARLGGDFDTLNTDQGFLNFLRQYPEGEQQSRLAMLNQYEIYMNLDGALGFFKEYLSSLKPQKKEPLPNVQPKTVPSGTDINPAPQASTKMWTRKEISQFYIDKASGKYNGREEEAKRLEADIFQAPTQGRVTA